MSQLEVLTTFDNTGIHADPMGLCMSSRESRVVTKSQSHSIAAIWGRTVRTRCCESESFPVSTKPPTISTSKLTRALYTYVYIATDCCCSWQYFDTGKVYRLFVRIDCDEINNIVSLIFNISVKPAKIGLLT